MWSRMVRVIKIEEHPEIEHGALVTLWSASDDSHIAIAVKLDELRPFSYGAELQITVYVPNAHRQPEGLGGPAEGEKKT
jgi:hypothetical protein